MDNSFFQFVETYWDEISEFFKALRAWVEALINKLAPDAEGDTTTTA